MKQHFTILLFFILLANHINLAMRTHFYGDEAIDKMIKLGETHLHYGMMDMEEPCDDSKNISIKQAGFNDILCCQNEFQSNQGSGDFVKDTAQLVFSVEFSVAFIYTMLNFDLISSSANNF